MTRLLTFLAAATVCSACNGVIAGTAGTEVLDSTGRAEVISGSDGQATLSLTVTLHNPSQEPVEFTVLDYCPVLVRLQSANAPDAAVVYSEQDRPCPRAGRQIRLAPGARTELARRVPLAELHAAGVTAGRYRAVGVVTAGAEGFSVDLGEVVIPGA